jgi:hypothetical protein
MLSPDTEKKRKGMWIEIDGVHEVIGCCTLENGELVGVHKVNRLPHLVV